MAGSDRQIVLYGAHGEVRYLVCPSDPIDVLALRPDSGLWGVAPVEYSTRKLVNGPGEVITGVRAGPRTFQVPVLISGRTELELDQNLASLGTILDPERDMRIVFVRPDNTHREITARYLSGAEAFSVKHRHQLAVTVPLVFRAHHPYWRSNDGERGWAENFNDAYFGQVNFVQLINHGDVASWPEITINGQCENIECANLTTGQVFRILYKLPAGQQIRIDTDPRSFGVWLNGAQGQSTVMDPWSEYWPMEPGLNRMYFRAVTKGVQPIGSFIIRWREQYQSP